MIAVSSSVIKSNPALVQGYVCAELQGSRDMTGPQAAKYLAASSAVQGVPGDQVVAATKDYPFILPGDQLYWLGSTLHDPTAASCRPTCRRASSWSTRAVLTSAPSAAQVAQHVDITFIKKALAGGCSSERGRP